MTFPDGKIIIADVLDGLRQLPDKSVQTCVTSPPFYGLRDYGTGTWIGGNVECEHKMPRNTNRHKEGGKQATNTASNPVTWNVCERCGATRQDAQIGLEQTPELYVKRLVEVFREVRRVLKDDGTVWLNLGDSYVSSATGGLSSKPSKMTGGRDNQKAAAERPDKQGFGLASKNLIGIPWMVAFALRADGWYLRQDIIWSKPSCMPESVRDRCTKSHEYIFLLAKSEHYYYDNEAIKEPATGYDGRSDVMYHGSDNYRGIMLNGIEHSAVKPHLRWVQNDNGDATRNKRSVWHVATEPYHDAHYATYPPALITPCIVAGAPKGGVVLDPFAGSGTTLYVARLHGREFIGIDLNPKNLPLMKKRLREALRAEKPKRPIRETDEVGTVPMFLEENYKLEMA